MSKTKNREGSELEHLRGENRRLESQNRQLKKRVRALDKRSHFYEDLVEEQIEDIIPKANCPTCKKGNITILDLKYVRFEHCDNCEYRKKL